MGGPSSREVLVNAATSILTELRNANVNSTSVATELNTLIYDLQDYINGEFVLLVITVRRKESRTHEYKCTCTVVLSCVVGSFTELPDVAGG